MHAQHLPKPSDACPVTAFPVERRAVRKTRFWTAIAVAALLLVGI